MHTAIESTQDKPPLFERLAKMAAEGCKRASKGATACSALTDGACFNCQAARIVRQRAINISLARDIAAAQARHEADVEILDAAADDAGGGRALAEYRLQKVALIAFDLIGALLDADDNLREIEDLAVYEGEAEISEMARYARKGRK